MGLESYFGARGFLPVLGHSVFAGLVVPVPNIVLHAFGLRRDLNGPKRGTAALAPARKRGAFVNQKYQINWWSPLVKRSPRRADNNNVQIFLRNSYLRLADQAR